MFLRKTRAQSTGEYAIVIGLVIAAAIAVQQYVQRSLQARVKGGMDALHSYDQTVLGDLEQWVPEDEQKTHSYSSRAQGSALKEDGSWSKGSIQKTVSSQKTSLVEAETPTTGYDFFEGYTADSGFEKETVTQSELTSDHVEGFAAPSDD